MGDDARNRSSYELIRLGADQTEGSEDDALQTVDPLYTDGTNQIDLTAEEGLKLIRADDEFDELLDDLALDVGLQHSQRP